MIVMPSNGSGWFWHSLARETGKLGHLYSPGGQRGPWPWFPYALDTGGFVCWDKATNKFDADRWTTRILPRWRALLKWAETNEQQPLWAVVPDVIGDAASTLAWWPKWAVTVKFKRAVAVQDGMTVTDVKALHPAPDVIAVGGSDEFKWGTVAEWATSFPRVHVLRVNAPKKLSELERMGVESCDGTGWNRGTATQTVGLEEWARSAPVPTTSALAGFVCKGQKKYDYRAPKGRVTLNLLGR